MCGPPDFGALNTCIIRLAELSAAGVGTYAVYRTACFCREFHSRCQGRETKARRKLRGGLIAESASGHGNA